MGCSKCSPFELSYERIILKSSLPQEFAHSSHNWFCCSSPITDSLNPGLKVLLGSKTDSAPFNLCHQVLSESHMWRIVLCKLGKLLGMACSCCAGSSNMILSVRI